MSNQYRFTGALSNEVTAALREAGWSQDRSIDISGWISELEAQGYRLNEPARSALSSLGGLSVEPLNEDGPNFTNAEPLTIDPILAGSGHFGLAEELATELGGEWFPIGEWLSYSSVFVRDDGWTVATGLGWIWELGMTVEEAVEFALSANHPLRCLRVLSPGAAPWPPGNTETEI